MQTDNKELSLIVPCYNSCIFLEKELPIIISYLNKNWLSFEIILVDDGSRDADETEKLADKFNCLFYRQPRNFGKGAALRKGFSMATGKVQIFTDSDFPFEPAAIKAFYNIVESKAAAIVIGDRTNSLSEYYIKVSWIRKIGSYLIAGFGKRLLKNDIVDTQCGLKAFSQSAAKELFPLTITNGFGIDFELLLVASQNGMDIKKMPVKLRTNYPSSVNVIKDGLKIINEIFRAIKHHGTHKQKRG